MNRCSLLLGYYSNQFSSRLSCALYRLPQTLLSKVQRVQNASARLVCLTGRREHITPVLKELHWLPVCQRISFKVLVLTYQALHGTAPQYMTDLLSRYQPTISLRSTGALLLTAPQSRLTSLGTEHFNMQPLDCGMDFRSAFVVRTI